jgi:beta-lactamase regulating signal transducer with metallopeptidase domain
VTFFSMMTQSWAAIVWKACWQGSLVLAAVWLVCRVGASIPARVQSWVWRLAVLKFLLVLMAPTLVKLPLLPAPKPVVPVHEPPSQPQVLAALTAVRIDSAPTVEQRRMELPSLQTTLFFLWIIGAGCCAARFLADWRRARRLRRSGRLVDDVALIEQLESETIVHGLRKPPILLATDSGGSPMLIGIVRPAILIPESLLANLGAEERAIVLGHELAHIRRGDLFWNCFSAVVRVVFFFNPLVWLGQRRMNLAQEIAADELAIARQRCDPAAYGKLLVSVVSKIGPGRLISTMAMGTAGAAKSLSRRLIAMKRIGRASRLAVIGSGALLAAVVLVGLVPWRLVAAESKKIAEPQSSPKMPAGKTGQSLVSPHYIIEPPDVIHIEMPRQVLLPSPYEILPGDRVFVGVAGQPKRGTEPEDADSNVPKIIPPAIAATAPGNVRENQRIATIKVWKAKKGQPKIILQHPVLIFELGQKAKAEVGNDETRLVVTVRSDTSEKPMRHTVEVRLIRNPESNNPDTLMVPRLTIPDDATGTVVVVKDTDGSELGIEASIRSIPPGKEASTYQESTPSESRGFVIDEAGAAEREVGAAHADVDERANKRGVSDAEAGEHPRPGAADAQKQRSSGEAKQVDRASQGSSSGIKIDDLRPGVHCRIVLKSSAATSSDQEVSGVVSKVAKDEITLAKETGEKWVEQVPTLGEIPYLNRLFRSEGERVEHVRIPVAEVVAVELTAKDSRAPKEKGSTGR